MVKKKEKAMTKREKVGMLVNKFNEAINSCKLEPTEDKPCYIVGKVCGYGADSAAT